MAIAIGKFAKHLMRGKFFIDDCSPRRHFFARLGLCEHKGEYITMKEYYERIVQEAYDSCHPYPRLFNVKTDEVP